MLLRPSPPLVAACFASGRGRTAASARAAMSRRVLVTGGNKGIGLAIVERLLTECDDTTVLLGSRDAARGEAARAQLLARLSGVAPSRLEVLLLDVSDGAQVARAAQATAPLFALVNNAGIADGDAATILDVNLRGVKRVVDAFAPLLAASAASGDARIVNVSSGAAPMFVEKCSPERQRFFTDKRPSWEALDAAAAEYVAAAAAGGAALDALGYPPPKAAGAYGFSKALLNSYTMLSAAALGAAHPGLRVNACSPGFIVTDLTRSMMAQMGTGKTVEEAGGLPPREGTHSAWFLLFGDVPGGAGGRYYGSDAKRSPLDRYRSPGSAEFVEE